MISILIQNKKAFLLNLKKVNLHFNVNLIGYLSQLTALLVRSCIEFQCQTIKC